MSHSNPVLHALLKPISVSDDILNEITETAGGIIEWLSQIAEVDVEGISPFDTFDYLIEVKE